MFILIPISVFIITFLIINLQKKGEDWREAFIFSSLVWGSQVTIFIELLSVFKSLDFQNILILWGASLLVGVLILFLTVRKKTLGHISFYNLLTQFGHLERLLLFSLIIVIGIIGLTALIAPPNNYDSMTYHMSRIVHWMQNRSVNHYPTHILRQLHHNPWAEFAILNLQILSRSDRYANLVQWFSLVGAIIGVSLIGRELKASRRGQLFVSLFCVGIPMAILQGSSTQNDLVVSFWLVCLVYFLLRFMYSGIYLYNTLGWGMSLGLAILTKATAYIYVIPFLTWLIIFCLKHRTKKTWSLILIGFAIAVIFNAPHYSRNFLLFNSPTGPIEEISETYTNQNFSFPSMAINIVRNMALHVGTPFRIVNSQIERGIYTLHDYLAIPPNDPRSTIAGSEYHINLTSNHEDYAGNLVPLIFICMSFLIYATRPGKTSTLNNYLAAWISGIILFCILLKWQPWNSRLHLPFFILGSPFVGYELDLLSNKRISNLFMIIYLLSSLPWVFRNDLRPIIGEKNIFQTDRIHLYFANQPAFASPYISANEIISNLNCSKIGLIMNADDWEYPFWALNEIYGKKTIYLEHIYVRNISNTINESVGNEIRICALINISPLATDSIQVGRRLFLRFWFEKPVMILLPAIQ